MDCAASRSHSIFILMKFRSSASDGMIDMKAISLQTREKSERMLHAAYKTETHLRQTVPTDTVSTHAHSQELALTMRCRIPTEAEAHRRTTFPSLASLSLSPVPHHVWAESTNGFTTYHLSPFLQCPLLDQSPNYLQSSNPTRNRTSATKTPTAIS